MSINGSNNPFACEPVVFSASNTIVALGTITRDGNEFTFSVGFIWKINGTTYQNIVPFVLTVANATSGFNRIDNALLNTSNGIELQQGLEAEDIALQPVVPDNAILLTSWNIAGATIDEPDEPITGNLYVEKEYFAPYIYSITGVVGTLALDAKKANVTFTGACTQLSSIQKNTMNYFSGQPFFLDNRQSIDVLIKHNSGSGNIKFWFPNLVDFILKAGYKAMFIFNVTSFRYEYVGIFESSGGGGSTETLQQSKWLFSDFLLNSTNQYPFLGGGLSSGTNAGIYSPTTPDGHLGNALMVASTSANSGYRFTIESNAIRNQAGLTFFGSFSLINQSDARDRVLRIGFTDQTISTTPTMGAFIEITGFDVVFKTVASSVATSSSSATLLSSTITAGVFYNVLIEFLTTTSVKCKLVKDDGTVILNVTHTTNIPLTSARFGCGIVAYIITAGTAHQICTVDYMGVGPSKPNFLNSF